MTIEEIIKTVLKADQDERNQIIATLDKVIAGELSMTTGEMLNMIETRLNGVHDVIDECFDRCQQMDHSGV